MPKTSMPKPTSLINRIKNFCNAHTLIKPGDRIVIGLSGGPDSVLLTHILAQLRSEYQVTIFAAHLDHGWRAESADDATYCLQLCKTLSIPLEIEHARNIKLNKTTNGSKEDLGRQLRRTFFTGVQKKHKANKIALAHHADDQIETFLIRLIRGATVSGLAAMRPQYGPYIRPLLEIPKKEIEDWLHQEQISYCIDPTNTSDDYLRNRIRNTLIPTFSSIDTRSSTAILKAIYQLQEADDLLETVTQSTYRQLASPNNNLGYLKLLALPSRYLQRRIVLTWLIANQLPFQPSKKLLEEILRFLSATKSNHHALFPGWSIVKAHGYAKLVPAQE